MLDDVVSFVDLILGKPLPTKKEGDERVGALRGVAILGLDALASAAYGPEALLTLMIPLGAAALRYVIPLTAVIVAILVVVGLSYRQTIEAYPAGGGSYTVANENLGRKPALLAAAALTVDYLLNVAVALSSGVAALASVMPALLPYTLPLCLLFLGLLTVVNLRGVRSSGAVVAAPTFLFIVALIGIIVAGVFKTIAHGGHPVPIVAPPRVPPETVAVSAWLLVRAFANGCTAMTGVEAVSNGVPIFREPRTKEARRTLGIIVSVLVVLLVGIAVLSRSYDVAATPPGQRGYQSILSQLTGAIAGRGAVYFVTMVSVLSVLTLSANTSFADFPRLWRLLALDGFLPEAFAHRGRRLMFSYGIVVLSVLSGALLIVFGGITDALIPLFAIGAFLSFTLSQAGMVEHWRRRPGNKGKLTMNAIGAICTGVTCCVVLVSKFTEGAWISVLVILATLILFWGVRRHKDFIERVTKTDAPLDVGPPRPPIAVVPMRRWDCVSLKALRFALGFAPDVVAVQVLTDKDAVDDLRDRWACLAEEPARKLGLEPPKLVVLASEYRRLYDPLIEHVRELARAHPARQVAVIVPELMELRWYHFFLHTHTASVLRELLLLRGGPQIVVVETPWYLKDWLPERQRIGRRTWFGGPAARRAERQLRA